ncbi:hypothetical protein Cylst_5666 [Cylindrospermum stagnale PCC 7417]|uniref:Uncharacterized protein n=1 Tax=Cylindrospermum stagnale PCC 7417 TaxID=56107 RepID=K9X6G5_9NOST|nr:HpsJ family protein [Cylindrospermum stagnale]AFZ27666.1 hypothetical protein Cylst_5666 [Cylindrospermum stagnale PCC 7417]
MVNRSASLNTALTLKVIGIVCVLSFFLDFLILLLDFNPNNKQSLIVLATSLVDRGIVPLVGLGLLFAAYWIDSADGGSDARSQGIDLRFPAMILSIILGLMFLVIFPMHLNNVNQFKTQTLSQISQKADQAESQIKGRLSQLQAQLNTEQGKTQLEQYRNQQKAQLTAILQNEQQYKQAIESAQVPQDLKELLKKAKANPQELDKAIAQQTDIQATEKQQLNLIRSQKEDAEKQAKDSAWKSGLRIGVSSLLLSIGYSIIGWTGLRGMGALQGGKRKAPAR